ncbi:MAG: universal stress protein [Gammaproteobacteria bacterium]|nr:universal stress protein [Gammaproteobacteria bacterium]MDH3506024.1 universal stress protein [Gammaproteobacteria bacterium]
MKEKIKRVLVALKPWQGGTPLSVYHARFLAENLGAELRLLSCVFEPEISLGVFNEEPEAAAAQVGLVESERSVLADLAASLADWGIYAQVEVRWGYPAEEVVLAEIESWQADLLVVGTHQAGSRPYTRLAQVDWQLMRSCPCPMLLARDPQFEGYTKVLAAVDPLHRHAEPSGLDQSVLEAASLLAKASESELLVAHVHPDPQDYALASAVEVLPGVYYGNENIEDVHRKALMELVENFGIRRSQVLLTSGDPAEQLGNLIVENDVDLVVLGALKRGRLEQWLLGSTAERVVAEVSCDVLLIKPEA